MQERTPNQQSMQTLCKRGKKPKNTTPKHRTIWINKIPQCRRPRNLPYGVVAKQIPKGGEAPSLRVPPVVLLFWKILTPHEQCFCQTTKPPPWSAGHLRSWVYLCGPLPCWCSFLRDFVRELGTFLHLRLLSRVSLSERAWFRTAGQQIHESMIHILWAQAPRSPWDAPEDGQRRRFLKCRCIIGQDYTDSC